MTDDRLRIEKIRLDVKNGKLMGAFLACAPEERTPDTRDRHGNYVGENKPGKGKTCCNITACQVDFGRSPRWWNTVTQAWYCQPHAWRINDNDPRNPICFREDDPKLPEDADRG